MLSKHGIQDAIRKHILDRLNDTKCKWDWRRLSKNPLITWDIVVTNPDKPWDWWSISRNPIINWSIV
jgi:hypothetical protein